MGRLPDDWFHSIKIVTTRSLKVSEIAQRKYTRKKHGEYSLVHMKPGIAPARVQSIYDYRNIGVAASIAGRSTKLIRLKDLAALYGIPVSSFQRWYRKGILPDPYMERTHNNPMYLQGQATAIVLTLNDIFGQGVKALKYERIEDHIKMMEAGSRIALEKFHRSIDVEDIKQDVGKFGIIRE